MKSILSHLNLHIMDLFTNVNVSSEKLQTMALEVIDLYNDNEFRKIFMERNKTDSKRKFYKHCVESVTQFDFEHSLSHQVNLTVQKIRREQTILTKTLTMSKSEEKKYYSELGGGDPELGKEFLDHYLND